MTIPLLARMCDSHIERAAREAYEAWYEERIKNGQENAPEDWPPWESLMPQEKDIARAQAIAVIKVVEDWMMGAER